MNTFIIKETNKDDYNRFLIWLSFENIIDHLNSIEEAPNIVNSLAIYLSLKFGII